MTSRPKLLKVAIAGQGRSGYGIHANHLRQDPERFRIVAVADQLPERRRDAEREFGAQAYEDHLDLIKAGGFDLFVNAMPTPLHASGSIAALAAGYHVLCEKPLAAKVVDFDRMVEAARKSGRLLAPFQNNRMQPFFLKLMEVVKAGVLGDLVAVRSTWGSFSRRWDWQTFQVNHGGCLYNTGPHAVDQGLRFFPEEVMPKVCCRMQCRNELGGDAEDFCHLVMSAPGHPQVEILITQYLAYPQGDVYSVSGTRGGLTGDHKHLRWKYYDAAKVFRHEVWRPWSVNRSYPGETLPWVEESWEFDDSAEGKTSGYTLRSYPSGTRRIYDGVYGAITAGQPLAVPIDQIRRQIAVMEEAHRQNPLPRQLDRWP